MKTEQIAKKLVDYCSHGDFEKAQKELYAEDVVSIEPHESQAFAKETKGLNAIIEKGHKFQNMTEKVYGIKTSEPLITGNSFAVKMTMDMQMKGQQRSNMDELCVYNVKDGKIISEQFFM